MATLRKGRLIILEGTDGSGKSTQAKLLCERLRKEGYRTEQISFPQYGKKSAGPIEEYLNGVYGTPDEVNPYAASLFYAIDRFDCSRKIRAAIVQGVVVICDRYVDSNAGHQGGKIKDPRARARFLKWLYELEYDILGVPRPDQVLLLHMPAEIGQEFVIKKEQRTYLRKGTHDAHEADLAHLKAAEEAYLWLVRTYPKNHVRIECVRNGVMYSPEKISEFVWHQVQRVLPNVRR